MPTLSHLTLYTPCPTLPNPLTLGIPDGTTLEGWQTLPRSRHLPPTLHVHEILLKTETPLMDPTLDEDHDDDDPIPDRDYRALYNALGWEFSYYHLYPQTTGPYLAHLRTVFCDNHLNHIEQVVIHLSSTADEATIRFLGGQPRIHLTNSETGALDVADYYQGLAAIHAFLNAHFLAVSPSRAHWLEVTHLLFSSSAIEDSYVPIGSRFLYNPANYCNPTS